MTDCKHMRRRTCATKSIGWLAMRAAAVRTLTRGSFWHTASSMASQTLSVSLPHTKFCERIRRELSGMLHCTRPQPCLLDLKCVHELCTAGNVIELGGDVCVKLDGGLFVLRKTCEPCLVQKRVCANLKALELGCKLLHLRNRLGFVALWRRDSNTSKT